MVQKDEEFLQIGKQGRNGKLQACRKCNFHKGQAKIKRS